MARRPGASTALGAIAAVFERFFPIPAPKRFAGRSRINRKAAILAFHAAMALARPLPECSATRACPWCVEGSACPRAELARAIAPAVVDPVWMADRLTTDSTMKAWLRSDGAGGRFYWSAWAATIRRWPR